MAHFKKLALALTFNFSIISFDSFAQTSDAPSQVDTAISNNFLFSQTKIESLPLKYKIAFFNYLNLFDCISGTVYFHEKGFFSTVAIQYRGNGAAAIKPYFDRCISGSKFTLDNCVFKLDGGEKSSPVSKTILFQ